ncbi:hypothetical protein WJX72_003414 [[Myrmecia] bisecta]|uniref:Peptidase M48 domain-containing protein n=1 Tax=[Myrmecia] bisecta TaxID=41462 RepID=A0AAW1PSH0_9CHLO
MWFSVRVHAPAALTSHPLAVDEAGLDVVSLDVCSQHLQQRSVSGWRRWLPILGPRYVSAVALHYVVFEHLLAVSPHLLARAYHCAGCSKVISSLSGSFITAARSRLAAGHRQCKMIKHAAERACGDQVPGMQHWKWQMAILDKPNSVRASSYGRGALLVDSGTVRLFDLHKLGAIIAHECGHAVAEHGEKMMTNRLICSVMAPIVAGLLFGTIQASTATLTLGHAAAELFIRRPRSRVFEYEADAVGLVFAEQAGLPQGSSRESLLREGSPRSIMDTGPLLNWVEGCIVRLVGC